MYVARLDKVSAHTVQNLINIPLTGCAITTSVFLRVFHQISKEKSKTSSVMSRTQYSDAKIPPCSISFRFEYHFAFNSAKDDPAVLTGELCSDDISRGPISTLRDSCTLALFVACISSHTRQKLLTGTRKNIMQLTTLVLFQHVLRLSLYIT